MILKMCADASKLNDLDGDSYQLENQAADPPLQHHDSDLDESLTFGLGMIFQKPTIRQFVHQGTVCVEQIHREPTRYVPCAEEKRSLLIRRRPDRFELFFDLAFVGVVHQMAKVIGRSQSGLTTITIFFFFPAWVVWMETLMFVNTSSTDDIFQRVYLFIIMCLLFGYAGNFSALDEIPANKIAEECQSGHSSRPQVDSEHFARLPLFTASSEGVGGVGGDSIEQLCPGISGPFASTNLHFAPGYVSAVRSAILFFLCARLFRIFTLITQGAYLPRFRTALWAQAAGILACSLVYLGVLFTTNINTIVALFFAGITADVLKPFTIAIGIRLSHARAKRLNLERNYPALAVEHLIERFSLFTLIVIGETMLIAAYTATDADGNGPSAQFWRAAWSVAIAFLLCWLYFDAASSCSFFHSLRISFWHCCTFSHLHFVLLASMIIVASGLEHFVETGEPIKTHIWFVCAGVAISLLVTVAFGMLHKSLDQTGTGLLPRSIRLSIRTGVAILILLLPLHSSWNSLVLESVIVAALFFCVLVDNVGRIGTRTRVYNAAAAQDLATRMVSHTLDRDESCSGLRRSLHRFWHYRRITLDPSGQFHEHSDLTEFEKGAWTLGNAVSTDAKHAMVTKNYPLPRRWAMTTSL